MTEVEIDQIGHSWRATDGIRRVRASPHLDDTATLDLMFSDQVSEVPGVHG